MGRIINEVHFGRLEGLLKNSKGQVVHGGDLDRDKLKMGITIVKGIDAGDSLMSDEIFGPLLPVLRVDTLDNAVSLIRKAGEVPLALYIFSTDRTFIDTVLNRCPSGCVTINDTLMQMIVPNLPFGGVGMSGAGFYRGHHGFLRFSQLRSSTETPTWGFLESLLGSRYPPYTAEKMAKMKRLTGMPKPPFTKKEGSASSHSAGGWFYTTSIAVIGGIVGIVYRQRRNAQS